VPDNAGGGPGPLDGLARNRQTRQMNMKWQSKRGITLIELMSAVVIIGIVSTMAVPRFQIAWERIKIRSVHRDIISTLRLARSLSITTKAVHGVHFDDVAQTVTLFRNTVNPGGCLLEPGDSLVRVDTLPTEFNYLGTDITDNVMTFRPNGSANFVGGGNIVALAVTEDVVGILMHNVLASTGRVQSWSYFY
jgi:prepilin-type N-terminal cleavage/methylation domain-containing protein